MSTKSMATRTIVSIALAGAACITAVSPATADTGRAHHASRSAQSARAQGTIAVILDGSTLIASAVGRNACQLRVDVTLQLTGTIDGTASGTTTAVIKAPCDQALATPPGTFADVFQFSGTFRGTVLGKNTTARTHYAGVTQAGGEVKAVLTLEGAVPAAVLVEAQAGGTGTYCGKASVHR